MDLILHLSDTFSVSSDESENFIPRIIRCQIGLVLATNAKMVTYLEEIKNQIMTKITQMTIRPRRRRKKEKVRVLKVRTLTEHNLENIFGAEKKFKFEQYFLVLRKVLRWEYQHHYFTDLFGADESC